VAFYDDGMIGSRVSYAPSRIGGLRLGRVVKVYPLDLCVDVVFVDTYTPATSGTDKGKKGEYRVRVPVVTDMAGVVPEEHWFSQETGWGKEIKKPVFGYGRVTLPQVGDFVVVGFLNENYTAPVVLGCLPPRLRSLTPVGATEDLEDEKGPTDRNVTADPQRYITVFPSGLWWKVNEQGEVEISFPLGKGVREYGGCFIKAGRDDVVGEAQGLIQNLTKAKEKIDELKKAAEILTIQEVKEVIDRIVRKDLTIAQAVDEILSIKDVQKVLSGDPHIEDDYVDGGCCCGAATQNPENPEASCSCGAGWATCPNCGKKVSGCPYRDTWVCPYCGAIVDNPCR